MTLSLTQQSDHVITSQLAARLTALQAGTARVETARAETYRAETSSGKADPVAVCDEKTCPYCCGPETD